MLTPVNDPDAKDPVAPGPGLRLPVIPAGGHSHVSPATAANNDPSRRDASQAAGAVAEGPARPLGAEASLEDQIIATLRKIRDPELPVNIYDLGLIYGLSVSDNRDVTIRMTLTTPACPVARALPGQVEQRVRAIPDVGQVRVELVWDPPWTRDRLSPAARLQLGLL